MVVLSVCPSGGRGGENRCWEELPGVGPVPPAEPQGKIYVDGILTSELGLHDLRQKMSIIPQVLLLLLLLGEDGWLIT